LRRPSCRPRVANATKSGDADRRGPAARRGRPPARTAGTR
jgi:hypothetical protein